MSCLPKHYVMNIIGLTELKSMVDCTGQYYDLGHGWLKVAWYSVGEIGDYLPNIIVSRNCVIMSHQYYYSVW